MDHPTVRPVLLLTLALVVLTAGEEPPLRFAHLSDPHLGQPLNNQRLSQVWQKMSQDRDLASLAFIVITGDILADCLEDPPRRETALALLAQAPRPLRLVPGNHDLEVGTLSRTRALWEKDFGPLVRAEMHQGVRCAFFWSGPWVAGWPAAGYDPGSALDQELARLPGPAPTLVFHHFPVGQDAWGGKVHSGWSAANRTTFLGVLARHQTAAVFCGHFHRDELGDLDGIPEYCGPPIVGYWGRQISWRICTFARGRLSYRTVFVDQ